MYLGEKQNYLAQVSKSIRKRFMLARHFPSVLYTCIVIKILKLAIKMWALKRNKRQGKNHR